MSAQNPKKVVDAACAGEVTVAGIVLRPFVLGLFPVLQKIDSPLLAEKGEKRKMETADIMRLILCLTIPAAEARRLIAQGIEVFDEAALAAADRVPLAALPELGRAIATQFATAVATAPGGGAAPAKKNMEGGNPLPPPSAPGASPAPDPATAGT
jgi:hypothetical protein